MSKGSKAIKSEVTKSVGSGGYVYSTLSNDQVYALWEPKSDGGPNIRKGEVFIRGKANVMDSVHFITHRGVATPIDDDKLDMLRQNPSFLRHEKAGYVTVEQHKEEPDIVAMDMTPKDSSAQLVDDDYEADKKKKPVTNSKK